MDNNPITGGAGWAWGAIRSAVAERATTADIWAAVRGAASRVGVALPPDAFRSVNSMRSLAVQLRNSAERFGRASADTLIGPDLATVGINARPIGDRNLLPMYKGTIDLTYTTPEGSTETRTVSFINDMTPGMTKADVIADANVAAEGMASDYGTGLVGWQNLSIELI